MNTMTATETVLTFADLALDTETRRAGRAGTPIPLTPTETRLLEVLVRARGEPVARADVLREMWGADLPCASTLGMVVLNLRRKTEAGGGVRLVHTLPGFGFVLTDTPPEASWHGTHGGYSNHKCRCTPCRDANAAWQRGRRAERAKTVPFDQIPHGEGGYGNYGCRCPECTEGHRIARRGGGRR